MKGDKDNGKKLMDFPTEPTKREYELETTIAVKLKNGMIVSVDSRQAKHLKEQGKLAETRTQP